MTTTATSTAEPEPLDQVVSRRLRELIAGRQLEQKTIADAAGMSTARLSKKLRNVEGAGWSLDELAAITEHLEVSVTSLLLGR